MRKKLKDIGTFFGKKLHRSDVVFHATYDSREVKQGSLFFALEGEKVDGHLFLKEVAEKGGIGAVVSASYNGESHGLQLIKVPDVRKALQDLAREVFQEKSPLVIGVTGSVGKTMTKEFLAGILSEKFRVAKSFGSMNSQVSLPTTVLNWEGQEEIFVLEMGMSEKGELTRLVEIAEPHLGVLTKITLAHAAFFESLEEIAEAKCELFKSKRMERGFFHLETERFSSVRALDLTKTWFHLSDPRADITLKGLPSPFEEHHLQENYLAAASVAFHLGMTQEEIEAGAKKLKPYSHRFEKVKKNGILFIDDSYNASPEGVKAALSALPKGKRRVGFLGAMRELGRFEEESHRDVAKQALGVLDHLICIGKECLPMVEIFEKEGKTVEYFKEKGSAVKRLKEIAEKGDVVLIKGANSFKLWTVLEEF
ncbi:MAG: UDP-N-acetylmuramoyl-tripeptide--D-alanyl-D-alanine ligase [Chlamydiia bacterium]|nr:UDP-N-acetylmuramoyl-tripeptide--D-alanyl-D-alanine ligase [Chlamydiia bacterium]